MFEVEIMKKLLILLMLLVSLVGTNAQILKPKRPALPKNLAQTVGQYPFEVLKNKAIDARLKTLLGKNYETFFETFETQAPFKMKNKVLFSSGCLIHACRHLESAIAIDLKTKTIHVGIFRQDKTSKIFNEDQKSAPKILTDWFKNLSQN
jgi:hypothetical protein